MLCTSTMFSPGDTGGAGEPGHEPSVDRPPMKHILALKTATTYRTDFCMLNRPWRNRTQIIGIHVDLSASERKCQGRGVCSRTGQPHVELVGKVNGVFRTHIAEPCPPVLCKLLAQCLNNALAARSLAGYGSVC